MALGLSVECLPDIFKETKLHETSLHLILIHLKI